MRTECVVIGELSCGEGYSDQMSLMYIYQNLYEDWTTLSKEYGFTSLQLLQMHYVQRIINILLSMVCNRLLFSAHEQNKRSP